MEDLVQFVKDLSPCLSKLCQDVDGRRRDLLNPYQRDNLGLHLDQVKTLAPILICSMKIFIQILGQEGKGTEEAVENRNYLAKRMTDEIAEIQRILEETTREQSPTKMAFSSSMSAVSGINVSEMTFHEVIKRLNTSSKIDQHTVRHLVELGYKIADGFDGHKKTDIMDICNELETRGHNLSKQEMQELLRRLELKVNEAVISRIIQDMADITTPLKQFTDAVMSRESMGVKRGLVDQKGQALKIFSNRLSKTAKVVAFANARNKRRSDTLHHLSSQVQNLTPQLINAGTIRMNYPENRAAEENFENLRKQYADGLQTIRDICDESIDIKTFLQQTEDMVRWSVRVSEDGIRNRQQQTIIDNTAMAARLSNRLLMVLNKESDNSDDPNLRRQVNNVGGRLKSTIAPFVENSRAVAASPGETGIATGWRAAASRLLEVVSEVTKLFDDLNMYGMDSARIPIVVSPPPPPPQETVPTQLREVPPPRPPLPHEVRVPGRPPAPDTDDEEGLFSTDPGSSKPIHQAAHGLYQEVRQVRSS